jgi:hypothetical protein
MQPNLNDVERDLKTLAPAPARIDRDRVLYCSGEASAARRLRVWQLAAVLCALGAACVIGLWSMQPAQAPMVRLVYVPAPAPETPGAPAPAPASLEKPPPVLTVAEGSPLSGSGYFARQRQVLRWGLDGLEGLPPEAARPRPPTTDVEVRRGQSSRLFARWPFAFRGDD